MYSNNRLKLPTIALFFIVGFMSSILESSALPQAVPAYENGVTDKNRGDKKGKINLKGRFVNNTAATMIYLFETEGRFYFKMDSTKIENGAFDFGTKEYSRGFYKLSTGDENNMASFILNPDEKSVELAFSGDRLESTMQSVNSTENKGWANYSKKETRSRNIIRHYKNQRAQTSDKTEFDQKIAAEEKAQAELRVKTIQDYPDTYLAKFLTYEQIKNPDQIGLYWEDLDFTDESIIRSTLIPIRMNNFMRTHSGGTDAGFIKCIDLTKAKAEVNTEVLEFVLFTMLDGFYQSNKENICQYILDNYIFDEDCGADLSDVIRQRAEGIITLQIGKTPPDFTIEKHDGGMLNMMETAIANKYTLVMFWSSWCHKCEQEMPVLKGVYSEYNPKGFEVIGVSVDTDRKQWVDAIEKKCGPWPQVSQLNSWKSPVAQDYRVTQTPTLFLVDTEGKIVLKPKRIYEVLNYLKENLK